MNKWRIFGAFLIIMSLLVMLIPAAEADAKTSTSAFSIKAGELIKYNGTDKTVSVPDTVTSIGKGAFEDNLYIEKVILPDSVKQIRPYAFWGCDNLKTVTLGKGLSVIGDFAFTNCTGLRTMVIPSNVSSIGIQAFSDCRNFEDITIPPQVFDISEDAFDGDCLLNIHCEEGTYADKFSEGFYERQKNFVSYGNQTSSQNPFGNSSSKPSNVPADGVYSGAEMQANSTYDGKDETTGFVIGATTVVGNQAVVFTQKIGIPVIGDESGLASAYVVSGGAVLDDLSKGITNGQSQQAVSSNDSVEAVNIPTHYRDADCTEFQAPGSLKEIGSLEYARSGVKTAVIPEGVEKIGYAAFYHCDDLTYVQLPESLMSVEAKAFMHTPWVDSFLSSGENGSDDFLISGGVLVAYRGNSENVVVPEGVRVIAGEAFLDHSEINKLSLPKSLKRIDDKAFTGCSIENIEYAGDYLSNQFLEETVKVSASSAAPEVRQNKVSPYLFVFAGILFFGGVFCIFKERY